MVYLWEIFVISWFSVSHHLVKVETYKGGVIRFLIIPPSGDNKHTHLGPLDVGNLCLWRPLVKLL